MSNLTNTAKKLDKIFEIARIVLGALAVAAVVFIVLIGLAYVMDWDPEFIGTGYASFDIGFLELEAAPGYEAGKPVIVTASNLTEAAEAARAHAVEGDVVTLSPACASFDQFPNFMARGKAFKAIVNGWQ